MKKLWQKQWQLNEVIESFETKDDLLLDQKLVKYDVYCSLVHAKMLQKLDILSVKELEDIQKGLQEILQLEEKGEFLLQPGDEDIHTKIENYLTEQYGEAGKKIHTGRSRNDQVLVAMRLFTKEQLLDIWQELLSVIASFQQFAKHYEFVPMPGYTHMQKAMPSSVGMWAASFVESFLDDIAVLENTFNLTNTSPLGSAAGYGAPLNLDRAYTAKLLGFSSVQQNSLYCQNSRGKLEAVIIASLHTILLTINKFATDVLLFSTSEYGYFTIAKELCSGSSIMPQKRNVDIAELLRSKAHVVLGHYVQVSSITSNLPSGYNRDLQDTKKPLMESLSVTKDSLKVTQMLIENITVNTKVMHQALTPEIFATHRALQLVHTGIAFRDAYQAVGEKGGSTYHLDKKTALKQATHIGATGNLGLGKLARKLQKKKQLFTLQETLYHQTKEALLISV